MGEFFIYSIKVSLCLAAFYLLYKLLLSRDTFHTFNRVTLLSFILLSLVLPWVHVPVDTPTMVYDGRVQVEQLLITGVVDKGPSPSGLTAIQVLFLVYVAGAAFFLVRETASLIGLYRFISGKEYVRTDDGVRIIIVDREVSPFSWFHNIVISRSDYESGRREILIHEKQHINRHHSLDIVLCNVLLIFQWFNPAMWLLFRELRNIHEYEADEAVLRSGADAYAYQLLLIRKAVGDQFFRMANNLNHNSLKKRITMMVTKRSNPWNRVKVLMTVPFVAVAVAAFATPKAESISKAIEHDSNVLVQSVVSDGMTAVGAGRSEAGLAAGQTEAAPVEEALSDTIRHETAVGAKSDDKVYDVVEEMPEFPGGLQKPLGYLKENVKYPEAAMKAGTEGRVIVQFLVCTDGSIKEVRTIRSVSPELDAEAVRVVSAMPKWKPGYNRGKAVNVRYVVPVTFSLTADEDKTKAESNDKATLSGTEAYVVIDGEHVDGEAINHMSSENVESIQVYKGQQAVDKFGEQAHDGAIVITTKKKK